MSAYFNVSVNMDAEDLTRQMERYELIEFLKAVDEQVGEWDFTCAMIDHFEAKHKELHEENKQDGLRSCTHCGVAL